MLKFFHSHAFNLIILIHYLHSLLLFQFTPCTYVTILYINSVSLFVCPFVKVLKPRSLLIKLSPRTQRPKNYSGPRVFTSYFYFYVCFRVITAVVDGGGIFGIWRVGEEIWVRFFWAKGLGGL
jgi:hypothetical protein